MVVMVLPCDVGTGDGGNVLRALWGARGTQRSPPSWAGEWCTPWVMSRMRIAHGHPNWGCTPTCEISGRRWCGGCLDTVGSATVWVSTRNLTD